MGELHKVITEILGGLIVLGVLLVLVMRSVLQKGKDRKQEAVEVSANRLRYELERSGDAIIGRMQIHVERLEHLLAEANQKQAALDTRLRALQKWEAAYGARLGMIPQQETAFPAAPPQETPRAVSPSVPPETLPPRVQPAAPSALPAQPDGVSFQTALARSMGQAVVGGSIDLKLPPEETAGTQGTAPPANDSEAVPARKAVRATVQEELVETGEEVPSDEDSAEYGEEYDDSGDEEFDVYESEETEDGYEEEPEAADEGEYEEEEPEAADEGEYEEEEPEAADEGEYEEEGPEAADEGEYEYEAEEQAVDEDGSGEAAPPDDEIHAAEEGGEPAGAHEGGAAVASAGASAETDTLAARQQEQIRSFLRQGLDVEEISRRLGLGRGAIELIRHMERRAQEAKDAAKEQGET